MIRRDPRQVVSSNLQRLASKTGEKPNDISRKLQLPKQTVRDWFLGNSYPRPLSVQKLADHFNVEPSDIIEEPDDSSRMKAESNIVQIPIIGTIKAGPNGIAEQHFEGYSPVDRKKIERDFEYYWLKITGDSMIGDMIANGDLALIKKTPIFENGDICAVIVDGEEGTLKHVSKNSNTIVLTAANPLYPPRTFVGEECNNILIAGKLVEIKREYHWFKAQKLIGYKSCT